MSLGPDYYKLGKTERILYLSGVPMPYLKKKIDLKKFNFKTIGVDRGNNQNLIIGEASQAAFLQKVVSVIKKFGFSATYAIGSHPTSQPAYDLVSHLSIQYYNSALGKNFQPRVKWVDLGSPDWSYLKDTEESNHMTVIHGLSEDSEIRRLELAKDFLRRAGGSTVFLLATTPNILQFSENKLGITPDAVCQLGKTVHRVAV